MTLTKDRPHKFVCAATSPGLPYENYPGSGNLLRPHPHNIVIKIRPDALQLLSRELRSQRWEWVPFSYQELRSFDRLEALIKADHSFLVAEDYPQQSSRFWCTLPAPQVNAPDGFCFPRGLCFVLSRTGGRYAAG